MCFCSSQQSEQPAAMISRDVCKENDADLPGMVFRALP